MLLSGLKLYLNLTVFRHINVKLKELIYLGMQASEENCVYSQTMALNVSLGLRHIQA